MKIKTGKGKAAPPLPSPKKDKRLSRFSSLAFCFATFRRVLYIPSSLPITLFIIFILSLITYMEEGVYILFGFDFFITRMGKTP